MSLREYARKRNFGKTPEPSDRGKSSGSAHRRFVIQKHAASRLHYDFRLELGGALKSWAVPKGLPYKHGEKHLAVHVEDHPLAYIDFEGTIPKGEYGGGTVMVWDRGTFEPLSRAPLKDLDSGKLHFALHGSKLEGEWHLVRLRDGEEWLLIRGGEDLKPPSKKSDDTSALSGKSMSELSRSAHVWKSKSKSRRGVTVAIPKFIEPMKAKLVSRPPVGAGWMYEIKFDGYRAIALCGGGEARLLSRAEKDLGAKFPEVLEAIEEFGLRDAILDGEIVALDREGRSSFQLLQAYEIGEERPPIFYYLFDAMRLDGRDLRQRLLGERKEALAAALENAPPILRYSGSLGSDAAPLIKEVCRIGLEGLIGKRADSTYESGRRSGAWVKIKFLHEQEFVIGGYTKPAGSRPYFGALILGVYEGRQLLCVGKVGSGFTASSLQRLHARMHPIARETCPFANLPQPRGQRYGLGITKAEMKSCHWVEPILVCQAKFSEWTRDARLRQPVFLGLREDKAASEVKREEPEV
jgi:bifunctional non-homologous end joining protein LigD